MESKEFILKEDNNFIAGDYTLQEVISFMEKYANMKLIEENESMLEMAKRHMDQRAILVLENRIQFLKNIGMVM